MDQLRFSIHITDSLSQISNRTKDRLGEFVLSFPLQSPVEYLTYIPAIPPEPCVIITVGHGVLDKRESTVRLCGASRGGGRTRIIVRRVLAEPRAI